MFEESRKQPKELKTRKNELKKARYELEKIKKLVTKYLFYHA
jgi:hypothetical protein